MNDAQRALVETVRMFIGVHEEGNNHGAAVERFQKAVDGKALGEPWCMCFVQFCVKEVEQRMAVRSNIFRSESCIETWNKSPILMRRTKPEPGSIAIWRRSGTVCFGHTGIVVSISTPEVYQTVEGNTSRGHGIEREGDGVYLKERSVRGTNLFLPLGFIQPF